MYGKIQIHLFSLLIIGMICLMPQTVRAQCADFGLPLNLSYEVPAEQIEAQIRDGCDPHCRPGEEDWCLQGGTDRGMPGTGGASITTNVSKTRMDCPATRKEDTTCEVDYPECTAKPGGFSDEGEDAVCNKGTGSPTVGVTGALDGLFPGFPDDFMDCLGDFLGGLNFSSIGGFVGSLVNGVTVSGSASASLSGVCAGGSVGFCGFSVGGEICIGDEDGNPIEDAADALGGPFIEVFAPGTMFIGLEADQTQGPIVVVDGGNLEGFGAIEPGQILAVTYDQALVMFPEGTDVSTIVDGTALGAELVGSLEEGTSYDLELNGLARVPSENVIHGEDDSSRCQAVSTCSYAGAGGGDGGGGDGGGP